jgi:hypothetical protein
MSPAIKAAVAAVAISVVTFAHGLTVVPDPLVQGEYSASFQGAHTLAGSFADRYDFESPVEGLLTISLDSATPVGTAGVSFSGYQLDEGPVVLTDGAAVSLVIGPLPLSQGPKTLTLGIVAAPALTARDPAATSYSGTIFINALPIPEPATWLTMVVGLLVFASYVGRPRAGRYAASA